MLNLSIIDELAIFRRILQATGMVAMHVHLRDPSADPAERCASVEGDRTTAMPISTPPARRRRSPA